MKFQVDKVVHFHFISDNPLCIQLNFPLPIHVNVIQLKKLYGNIENKNS